jgi:hypothetical protein
MSDKQVDEINLKDLSKKIAQSSGNKNVIKAMKPSVDKTKSDLAAMRKRLDALKAGYAAESVELEEGVIDQVKDIVANKQAKKISGVMVDMFTASAISQIYDKVNDANKAKMDKLPIVKLADVAMKMMKKEGVENLEEMKNTHALIDTADGNKVVSMASSEQGVKQSKASAERPPMSVKDKNTLKIVKLRKAASQKASERMIGYPLKEEVSEANTYVGQRDKMKIVDRKPHPEGGHIVTMQTRTGKTIKRRLHKGKVTDMNEDLQIDEVLDTPKAMQSYRDKAKYSADRAASSAAAKILRGKDKDGNRADHSPEVKTRDKRAKGLKMVDRNATRKVFKALRKEETQIDEASKEGTIRIIDLGRMGKGKGFQVQRMTKGKFVDQGKPYKSQKDAEKVRKDGQHSMQFEAAPKIKGDWLKKERERNREHDAAMGRTATGRKKPTRTMTSTQKSLASFREQMAEGGMKRIATTQSNKIDRMASGGKKGLETFKKKPTAKEAFEPHMMYDPKTGKGYKAEKEADHLRMKKMGYTHDKPEVNEKYKIMHKTMSAALQHAYDEAEKKGYEVDKDDIDNKVAMGPRKPSSGKTNSYNLGLSKKGKPVKQKLHVQVYNMDNKGYELNMYVS